jgi:hypothetical protein
MAARFSRYREPPVALPVDARGRAPASTPLRVRPDTAGTFQHIVAAGERLDQIAYRYYEEPTVWWRICDANPDFLSPLALLGQLPITTLHFALTVKPSVRGPDWSELRRALAEISGVEDTAVIEEVEYFTVTETVPNAPKSVEVIKERFRHSLVVTFNRAATSAEVIAGTIRKCGFDVSSPVESGQLGQHIVIPPLGATP